MTTDCETCRPLVKVMNPQMSTDRRRFMIESKAAEYRKHMGQPSGLLQKGARAIFDPKLGPSGGYRCPEGSQFGGYITDRFGRGCGGGIIRRVGRAFGKLGRGLDNIADRRDRSRLGRAVNRRSKPNRVARAAGALERGAQRLVGEYKPGDYKPGDGGRRNRRNLPGGPSLRRSAVPRKPKRERKLPKDGDKKPRTQGATPKKRPIIERAAEGLERAAQRVLDEDRKKRTQGAKPAKPKKPVAPKVPSLKPNLSEDKKPNITDINDIDWDNLTPEQQDELQGIASKADSDIEDLISEHMGVSNLNDNAFRRINNDNWVDRQPQKIQRAIDKWKQLNTSWRDRPDSALKEIDWTDEERKKILDVVNSDVKPDVAKDGGEFNWDNLTPEQRGKIKDIANNALEDDKKALLKHFGAASWNNDRLNRAIDLADKGFIKKDKANEIEKIALRWNLLQTQWNDEPNLAINDINWTDDQRQQIRDAIGIEAPKKPKTRGADFWERRKNNKPIKPEEIDVDDAPEIFSSKPDGTSESNRLVKAWEQAYQNNIDKHFADKDVERLEKLKKSIDLILNKDVTNLSPAMRRMLQEKINDIEKKTVALRARKARGARTATPKPKLPSLVGKPVSRQSKITRVKENVIDALRIKNRRKNEMGDFAPDAIGDGALAFPENIVNDEIKNGSDAGKWLDDGKSLYEIPQHYWLEAIERHINSPYAVKPKQYQRIAINNPGAIKTIFMFERLDKDGKGTGTGVVFARAKGNPRDGMGEVLGQQVLNALGMNVAPARFDGIAKDNGVDVPVAVMPFAWNRAAQGDMERPSAGNFNKRLFNQFEDKGFPARLGNLLGNYLMGVGDRHSNNAMMAIIDGQPHIVPIDLGWNGVRKNFRNYPQFEFSMDSELYDYIAGHLVELNRRDPAEAEKQRNKLIEVFDGMILRGDSIIAQGKDKFVKDAVAMMHLDADAVPNMQMRDGVDRKELNQIMEIKAADIFDALKGNIQEAKDERALLFAEWGLENVPPLGVLEVVRKPKVAKPRKPKAPKQEAPAPAKITNNVTSKSKKIGPLPALVVAEPQKRYNKVPVLGKASGDNPLPIPDDIVNSEITNLDDAVRWLDEGNRISQVPQKFWAQAINGHVDGNAPNKQFTRLAQQGGIIKMTQIFGALDNDGNFVNQGFLLQYDGDDPKNAVEVFALNIMHGLGLNVEPARFDGVFRPDEVPVAVMPFAWNNAPEGDIVLPKDLPQWDVNRSDIYVEEDYIPNFEHQQFEDLPDKAYPQRIAAMIGNFILQIPDRHNQNGMGAMVGGKPHVVPIDLGWAGKHGYLGNMNMFFAQQFKIDRTFDADNGDMEPDFRKNISNHWSSISDNAERVRQQKVIVDLYDDMITRGKAMTQDKDKFINDLLIGLHDAGNNAIIRNKAEQEARNMLKMMMRSIANMESERDNYLKSIFSIDEAVIKGGA